MNDRHEGAVSLGQSGELPENVWAFDEFTGEEERSVADFSTGLTSLGYLRAALRRSAWLWCGLAVAGMLIGFGLFKARPAPYQASTSLLLQLPPGAPPGAIADDQAIAQSRTVAGIALRILGSRQSAPGLASDYTVTGPTDRVLIITAKTTSPNDAVREANAVATAFLRFQAHLLKTQEQLTNASLQEQVTQAQQQINSISNKIRQLLAHPGTPQAQLNDLRSERTQAIGALTVLKQTTTANQASNRAATVAVVNGSKVLDTATPTAQHRTKRLVLLVGGGLLAGLSLGMSIVIVRALITDRLRRRDDVAQALGAPVKLSVGKVRVSRWWPGRRGLAASHDANVRRIVSHLGRAVQPASGGAATLAVIPIGDTQVAALSLVSLACGCAQEGSQVVVADLCSGSPAARLLGAKDPGVHPVTTDDAHLTVVIPDGDDLPPTGPLAQAHRAPVSEVAAASSSADLLLTLVSLDPALGGEHLAGWAASAVAVVTAGDSSAARIHAVGEMARLAGIPLISAVLVGADKTDESLGVTRMPEADSDANVAEQAPQLMPTPSSLRSKTRHRANGDPQR